MHFLRLTRYSLSDSTTSRSSLRSHCLSENYCSCDGRRMRLKLVRRLRTFRLSKNHRSCDGRRRSLKLVRDIRPFFLSENHCSCNGRRRSLKLVRDLRQPDVCEQVRMEILPSDTPYVHAIRPIVATAALVRTVLRSSLEDPSWSLVWIDFVSVQEHAAAHHREDH